MEALFLFLSKLTKSHLELTPEEFERIEKKPINREDHYYYDQFKKIG